MPSGQACHPGGGVDGGALVRRHSQACGLAMAHKAGRHKGAPPLADTRGARHHRHCRASRRRHPAANSTLLRAEACHPNDCSAKGGYSGGDIPSPTAAFHAMTRNSLRQVALLLGACGVAMLCAGCSSGPKNFENENDALRRRVVELEKEVGDLKAANAELTVKVHEATRATGDGRLSDEVFDALPRCATLEIGGLSGLADTDGSPGLDVADVYIRPLDGRGRFTQVSGWLTVRVSLLPAEGQTPLLLGEVRLSPAELREAYRSSFTGTHYSVRLHLTEPNRPLAGVVTLAATFEDGVTGATITAAGTRILGPGQ